MMPKTEAFSKFMHALLGLYMYEVFSVFYRCGTDSNFIRWEFVTSLDFDWQFISGVKTFRWPLVGFLVFIIEIRWSLIHLSRFFTLLVDISCSSH